MFSHKNLNKVFHIFYSTIPVDFKRTNFYLWLGITNLYLFTVEIIWSFQKCIFTPFFQNPLSKHIFFLIKWYQLHQGARLDCKHWLEFGKLRQKQRETNCIDFQPSLISVVDLLNLLHVFWDTKLLTIGQIEVFMRNVAILPSDISILQ